MAQIILDAVDSQLPDIALSSDWYATRFSNAAGAWFLDVQAQALLASISQWTGGTVLDVGGGHGQLIEPLAAKGYDVTVLGSSGRCARRISRLIDSGACSFQVGNLMSLPFADQSFDLVISFRMMAHMSDWKRFLQELNRVARKAIVVDYAVLHSLNCFASKLFWIKRIIEGNTTGFVIHDEREILNYCKSIGLVEHSRFAQYFLPMALHRCVQMPPVSQAIEQLFRTIGLTDRAGSPVISCLKKSPLGSTAS